MIKKICPAIFLLSLLSASHLYAQIGIPQTNPSGIVPPRAEATLSKAVVRITSTVEGVSGTVNATGFIVSVPELRLPGSNPSFTYLVTNRHVAEAIMPDASGNPISHRILQMDAIVNLKTPLNGTKAHTVPLLPHGWHFPADGSIDLAVIPFVLDETYDVARIPSGIFMTENLWEKFRVVPGDKVMTCGYFLHYAGAHQFQPIMREGSLAMVPDDSMLVAIGGRAKVYLADLHIIPGNSGSPLFLAPAYTLGGLISDSQGGSPYGLLGVVSGYMWEDDKLTLHAATDYEGTIQANSGIAVIVPVDQLKALLDSPELQRERNIVLHSVAQRVTKTEDRLTEVLFDLARVLDQASTVLVKASQLRGWQIGSKELEIRRSKIPEIESAAKEYERAFSQRREKWKYFAGQINFIFGSNPDNDALIIRNAVDEYSNYIDGWLAITNKEDPRIQKLLWVEDLRVEEALRRFALWNQDCERRLEQVKNSIQ